MENKNRFDITEWRHTYLNEAKISTSSVGDNYYTLEDILKKIEVLGANIQHAERDPSFLATALHEFRTRFVVDVEEYLTDKMAKNHANANAKYKNVK